MTDRERYLAANLFGTVDRVPFSAGGGRKSTRERWHSEGLPESVEPGQIAQYAYRQVGGTLDWPTGGPQFRVHERMIPQFEEKVIEDRGDSLVVQDWKGNVCEISSEFGIEYLRNAIDFVTRRWIKCPVENWDEWEAMKARYDAEDPTRLPDNPAALGAQLKERHHVVAFGFSGPFWQLREWVGFEGLCMLFHDDPDLVRDMVSFWTDYVARLLERALEHITPDEVHLSEDMAYKQKPMIGPDMAREFLAPCWARWGEIIRGAGVPVYSMDSDGFIGDLIPVWIDCGMNACDPIEVAALNDINEFRARFGRRMAFRGGVDKRCMAKGGQALADEIARLRPVIDDGGYLPGCDHGVPSDVSWPNYLETTRLLAQACGWL